MHYIALTHRPPLLCANQTKLSSPTCASHPVQPPRTASRKCNQRSAHRIPYNDRAPHRATRPIAHRAHRSCAQTRLNYLRPRAHRPRIDHAHIAPAHRPPIAHRPPLAQPTRTHIASAHRTPPTDHRSHNRPRGTTVVPCCRWNVLDTVSSYRTRESKKNSIAKVQK